MSTKDTIGKYNLTEPKLYMNYAGWYLEEFEDTKEAVRNRISKKNRQDNADNGQKKKYKRTNNDLQIIHIKQKIE